MNSGTTMTALPVSSLHSPNPLVAVPVDQIQILHDRIRELEDEISSVRAEAVEAVSFWGEFASNYSKVHHDLAGDIASLRGPQK